MFTPVAHKVATIGLTLSWLQDCFHASHTTITCLVLFYNNEKWTQIAAAAEATTTKTSCVPPLTIPATCFNLEAA